MSRKKETITLSIPPGTKAQLEAIASRLGITWGESPSVSGLIVAIAQAKPETKKLFTLNSTQVAALQQAVKDLIDSGWIAQAKVLLTLLLEQANLETPVRQSLSQLVNQPSLSWRTEIEHYINTQQPFCLFYKNAQEQQLDFSVRYAEIVSQEKRFYLNIWCEETEDIANTEFPELIHNRCLRLDRIRDVQPINKQWRHEGLDFFEVYLHFHRGMIKAYEPKANDDRNEVIGDVRQVVRKVSNPFWLIREVFRYGEDCEIVSPENLRDRFREKVKFLCQRYGIETQDK